MFNLPKRPMSRLLAVSATALALAATGAAAAQSSPDAKPAPARGAAVTHTQASTLALLTSSSLSDSVGFDIVAGNGLQAEVIPGVSPSFRYNTGWTSVTHIGTGHYCLNGGVVNSLTYNYPAVVSVTSIDTPGYLGYLEYDSHGTDCPGVGVWTRSF